jgi:hypothetical protein
MGQPVDSTLATEIAIEGRLPQGVKVNSGE